MPKNMKSVSVSIDPTLHDRAKEVAVRKGLNFSELVCDLLKRVLDLDPDDEYKVVSKNYEDPEPPAEPEKAPEIEPPKGKIVQVQVEEGCLPVVLKIPLSIATDQSKLNPWLGIQVSGVARAMASKFPSPH